MGKMALIVAGGTVEDELVKQLLSTRDFRILLAADRGMEFFYRCKVEPTHIVGDFDSVKSEAHAFFEGTPGIIWRQFPAEKDATDTELAIKTVLEYGATEICIVGATGTRIDHMLSNIYGLREAMERGVRCEIIDAHNRIYLADEPFTLKKEAQYGDFVSLLPLTESVKGLTLRGFKYELKQATLCKNSLGVSNEIVAERAEVDFADGILIVIESKD